MNSKRWVPAFFLLFAAGIGQAAEQPPAVSAKVDFSREVKPLLAEHCLKCHGPDKAEGGLNLVDRAGALKELESGSQAIVPGDLAKSELIRRITEKNADERMPPPEEKRLSAAEIELLRRWVAEGAEYQVHWAYRPLVRPTVPNVARRDWVRSAMDSFVLAKLEERKLAPSPAADPRTLIKRVSLDLTGLLPDPAETEAFARDPSDAAYEAVIDRLLASPHFGERWGRHWLDMARYADSDGYEKDKARPDAYLYRDWVIHAIQRDLPFDRFTIEQLAGDLLPGATVQQKIATAFNRQTLTNTEGGVDQEEYRVAAVFDRTDTLGSVWLGLTVGCAKCHNHKYDPISQTEYYRLFAFFNGADEVAENLVVSSKDPEQLAAQLRPLEEALEQRYRALTPAEQKWEEEQRALVEKGANTPLKLEEIESLRIGSAGKQAFLRQSDGSYLASSEKGTEEEVAAKGKKKGAARKEARAVAAGDVDTLTLTIEKLPPDFTGLRLETLPDPSLPQKGAGQSANGNFVISSLRASVVDAAGRKLRDLALQRATADYSQPRFAAADVLVDPPELKKGWAIGGQIDKPHYLQVRTSGPQSLAAGERLQLVIEQKYGGKHLLGRFKLRAISGDARDLHLNAAVVDALKMYPEKRVNETRELLFDFFAAQDPEVKKLQAKIAAVNQAFEPQRMQVRLLAGARKGRATHRFHRGDFLSPAEEVSAGGLAVLPPLPAAKNLSRRELAEWLVGGDNPLTPRVAANQIWAHLFGAGLVRSVNDFGSRGEVPSHPELLDWLAITYRDDLKWSRKKFLKAILLSATYRQSSAHRADIASIDPLNTLLSRQSRLRVEGEIVRDLALQAGGLLSPKVGGPSVFPPMPPDLAKLSYANSFSWTNSEGEDRYRRGMYTFFKRTIPHPSLMTFDCPDANLACVNRSISNTPLQALTLLNNEVFVESCQGLARRLLGAEAKDDAGRLAQAFRLCLAREPSAAEVARLSLVLDDARKYYRAQPKDAEQLVGKNGAKGVAIEENAAWIVTARILLNLDEFITRE